ISEGFLPCALVGEHYTDACVCPAVAEPVFSSAEDRECFAVEPARLGVVPCMKVGVRHRGNELSLQVLVADDVWPRKRIFVEPNRSVEVLALQEQSCLLADNLRREIGKSCVLGDLAGRVEPGCGVAVLVLQSRESSETKRG